MNTPDQSAIVISARGLHKHYQGGAQQHSTPALNGVDIDIVTGSSVAIMGASGSGKTTLLHVLAGILLPDSGSVSYRADGARQAQAAVSIESLGERQRSKLRREAFGFVFQQGLLLDELTAVENVALALMLNGVAKSPAQAQAAQWLAALGLQGLEERRIGELSGGQAQRVAIARAQVTGAQVIFADEPTGALDSATSADVMSALLDSTASGGKTLVLVTHDPTVASRCGRVIQLRDGQIFSDSAFSGAAIHPASGSGQNGSIR
ncbi:ABC transporter ATP-binding protein [Acaricomes phytoseiuli]|uniref:ABC transporter ATP-binding protein n=1 Tax=Acaricomes phytoseiuli TaxID=291968 RepID=UPI00039F24BA|nr:ABC transporter ATP-binding protein [Acaricomes phytoseiuli]MCW1250667.1 ABC transporter ATP-binding protein [Acaricomes phytoseiuli]